MYAISGATYRIFMVFVGCDAPNPLLEEMGRAPQIGSRQAEDMPDRGEIGDTSSHALFLCSGRICITGRTFCAAGALLTLMADRAPIPVAAHMTETA
jgi:hypothetical protein